MPPSSREYGEVVVMRPRRAAAIALAIYPFALVGTVAAFFGPASVILAFYLFWIPPLILHQRSRDLVPWKNGAHVRVSRDGVYLDEKLVAKRSDIRSALCAPTIPYGACIRIERGWRGPLEIWLKDEAQAHELVAKLGLDATRKKVDRQALSPLLEKRSTRWLMVVTAIVSLVGAAWLRMGLPQFAIIGAGLMALSVLALIPTRVTLGSDGLLLRWLGREQFVKLSDIEDVGEWRGLVRLQLRGRREAFDIPVAMRRVHSPLVAFDVAILAGRIREAIRAQHKGPPFDTTLLERSSRAVPDWLASLRQLTAQTGAYRAALHAEDLWHVLEDPSARPSARGAAAVVLGRSLDERGRAKLRVLSESSAVPKLRVALEAVARDDDAALTAALAAMEDETSAQRGAAS